MRDVTLVIGPPCAGKTTHVHEHAHPGDLIVDWDQLAIEAGSPVTHDHPDHYRRLATIRQAELEAEIAAMPTGRAWVIRTAARPEQRARLAHQLNARIHTIDPGPETCLQRARLNGRDPDVDRAILDWYAHAWGARHLNPLPRPRRPNPRITAEWRAIRKIVLRGQPPCWRGHPMRYDVPYNRANPDPLYPTVDHIIPVSQGGAWYDLANLRPACWEHNTDHTSEPGQAPALLAHRTSEDW